MNGSVYVGNRGGIPVVRASTVVGTTDVTISLPNNIFRFLGAKGIFTIELTSALPSGTTSTLPVLISVNGETRPLIGTSGVAATAADIATTLYMQLLFDKVNNVLVLMIS